MGKVYKNGIVSPKGFDMAAGEPVDQRTIVDVKADLYSLGNTYPGLEVKVVAENYTEYKLIQQPSTEAANWVLSSEGSEGPAGPQGPQGEQGIQGPTGPAGAIGAEGPAGATGPQGNIGPAGAQGVQGVQGATGPAGSDGAVGAQGPQGDQGIQGDTGPAGSGVVILGSDTVANILLKSGSAGDMWIATDTGTDDNSQPVAIGDGMVYDGADWLTVGPIRGPEGPQGATGATGATGAAGADGADGAQGIQGIQGIQGDAGADGVDGAQGIQGLTGPAGADGADGLDGNTVLNGIVDPTTEGVDDDFYINTVTNEIFGPKTGGAWGAGTSLVGPQGIQGEAGADGADGAQGPQGIQGVQGPQGEQGIPGVDDTYSTILTVNSNYTTLDTDSNKILNVLNPTTTITLDSALLTIGFKQQLINDTVANLTINLAVGDSSTGIGNTTFSVPIGHFAFYVVSSANTWSVAIGVSDSNQFLLKSEYEGSAPGIVIDSDSLGGLSAASYRTIAELVTTGSTFTDKICYENSSGLWVPASPDNYEAQRGRLLFIPVGTASQEVIAYERFDLSYPAGDLLDLGSHIYLTGSGTWGHTPPGTGYIRSIGYVAADVNDDYAGLNYVKFNQNNTSITADATTINGITIAGGGGGGGDVYLANSQTFTGTNTFSGSTNFTGAAAFLFDNILFAYTPLSLGGYETALGGKNGLFGSPNNTESAYGNWYEGNSFTIGHSVDIEQANWDKVGMSLVFNQTAASNFATASFHFTEFDGFGGSAGQVLSITSNGTAGSVTCSTNNLEIDAGSENQLVTRSWAQNRLQNRPKPYEITIHQEVDPYTTRLEQPFYTVDQGADVNVTLLYNPGWDAEGMVTIHFYQKGVGKINFVEKLIGNPTSITSIVGSNPTTKRPGSVCTAIWTSATEILIMGDIE